MVKPYNRWACTKGVISGSKVQSFAWKKVFKSSFMHWRTPFFRIVSIFSSLKSRCTCQSSARIVSEKKTNPIKESLDEGDFYFPLLRAASENNVTLFKNSLISMAMS